MVIFNSYVSLPEGIPQLPWLCDAARRNMKAALHASLNPEYRAQMLGEETWPWLGLNEDKTNRNMVISWDLFDLYVISWNFIGI